MLSYGLTNRWYPLLSSMRSLVYSLAYLTHLGAMPPSTAIVSVPLITNALYNTPQTTSVSWSLAQPLVSTLPQTAGVMLATTTSTTTNQSSNAPHAVSGFSLSPATAPFPQKLVDKVRSGQFVEMRDLLTDNISLRQLEAFGAQYPMPTMPGILKPRLREVSTLPSWLYCFLAYVAIRTPDTATREMLAYARLIIRESQRHGGNGWLEYDRVFRQQAALDNTMRWNTLDPGIQAGTLMGQTPTQRMFCSLCREPDHTMDSCALAYLQAPSDPLAPVTHVPTSNLAPSRSRLPPRRRPESLLGICVSWNKGKCIFPNTCTYKHICATCHREHMARTCAATPSNSEYKLDSRNPTYRRQGIPQKPMQ